MSHQTQQPSETPSTEGEETNADLRARIDVLEEENRRLRREYVRARQTQYRRTAFGLAGVGAIAALLALLFPAAGDLLLTLGAIGGFGAILTYYLTPEQFISTEVGGRVYDALAANEASLTDQLGLTATRVYVPTDEDPQTPACVFVPQHDNYTLPDSDALSSILVIGDDEKERGVAFEPTGGRLFTEFERTLSGPLAETPSEVATQLTDALVEGFELAESAQADVDADGGRISVRVTGSAYDGDQFDNPLASLVAVGIAVGLDTPVVSEVTLDDDSAAFTITCRWETGANADAEPAR